LGLFVVLGLSLLMTRAFGGHTPGHCATGESFPGTGYGYGYSPSSGYGYGYGPCPSPTPTATPTSTPVGTITLLDSDGNPTTSFEIGEDDNTAVLDNLIAGTYRIDFAQSPGEVIGSGTTNAQGDARIPFDVPGDAHAGAATLTFLRGTTTDRTLSISILGQATSTAVPTAVPVSTSIPTLPDTGAQVLTFMITALSLIAFGTALKLAARRRLALGDVELPTWIPGRTTIDDAIRGLRASRFGKP
jgi:hypothetical protein